MRKKLKLGILLSGTGSNAEAIIDACSKDRLYGEVLVVGSDRRDAKGLLMAKAKGIDTFFVDYKEVFKSMEKDSGDLLPKDLDLDLICKKQALFPKNKDIKELHSFFMKRAVVEKMLLDALLPYGIDLLVLAGFMRTLSPYFLDRMGSFKGLPKIMNIHPALLPSFPGMDGYGDTFNYGCRIAGCTVHFIDYGEDSGPVIGQAAFPILPEDTLADVRKKGLAEEWKLYPQCIQLYAEGRLKLEESRLADGRSRKVVRILPP